MHKGRIWQVNNYTNRFLGETTLRKALALSQNTPAVRLGERIGINRVIEFATKAGISSPLFPSFSLALGTSEVSLLELTAAYIPFANLGVRVRPVSILRITDSDARVIYQHTAEKKSIMTRQDAAIMADMLKAVIREGTGAGASTIQKDIAGKTGTTDNNKDALFIGFSPEISLGVWVGNDDSTSLGKDETGAKAALPIWVAYMQYFLKNSLNQYFDIPDGTQMVYMDPDTGKLNVETQPGRVQALVKTKDIK
jgi:penicillin-binding protein 1A